MKTFEVVMKAYKTVIVEANDAEEAERIASEECTSSSWEIESWQAEELLRSHDIKVAKQHGATTVENWDG